LDFKGTLSKIFKAQMDWAGSPAETRGVQPPKTPAEFTEWKKTHTSIEIFPELG
jgi:hypothetical protein